MLLWVIAQSSTSFIIFPQLPSFPSVGRPSPSPKSISRFASAISAFISTISTLSFSSHSSRAMGMLYHKNTEFRASDAASAIRGYHNQRISFKSLLQHFTYITSHDAFRMHHPEAPRAALAQKPPKQKEPPRKGTKRWHKEQTRRRAAERRRAIRNVLELIDSLDAGYTARPAV